MKAVDTNILVYAHRSDSPWHEAADRCLSELAETGRAWGIPWPCIHEFLSVVTHPKIYRPPSPLKDALLQVECWIACPTLHLLGELPDYWTELSGVLEKGQVCGPRVHDARIAAICRQHGARALWSADRDLGRFTGLLVTNPLVS